MQARDGGLHQHVVRREHADELFRMGEYDQPGGDVVDESCCQHKADGLAHTVVVAGAVVEAHDGDGRAVDAADGLADDFPHGIDDGERADIQRARGSAKGLQRKIYDGLGDAVGKLEHKARGAELEDAGHLLHVEMQAGDAQQRLFPGEEADDPHRTHELGDDRGDGRAFDAHMEHEQQEGVQYDIQRRADENGAHADFRETHAVDEGVHPQTDEHEHAAEHVDAEIAHRVRQCVGVTAHGGEEGPCEQKQDDGKDSAERKQHRKSGLQNAPGPFVIAFSAGHGTEGIAAGAAEVGEGRDQGDERKGNAHAGQRRRAYPGNVADEDPVHHVI